MNTKFLGLALILGITCFGTAHAYQSGVPDPSRGEGEREYRVGVKSVTAGYSDAIAVGDVLSLDIVNTNDGYTLTRVGANTNLGSGINACVATKAIATGNTALFRCVSRGYVNVSYDATTAITAGQKLCANAAGAAVTCAGCVVTGTGSGTNDCRFGTASGNAAIISLEAKASGTGTNLKALVLSR